MKNFDQYVYYFKPNTLIEDEKDENFESKRIRSKLDSLHLGYILFDLLYF